MQSRQGAVVSSWNTISIMSKVTQGDGKRIAQWGAVSGDVAVVTAFAIILGGDWRLAALSGLGLFFVLNTIWLMGSLHPMQQLGLDVKKVFERRNDRRYVTIYEYPLMPVGTQLEKISILVLRPPNHRWLALNDEDPLAAIPDVRCTVHVARHRDRFECTNVRRQGSLIIADYPAELLRTGPDELGSIPEPGKHIAHWETQVPDIRLPRYVMRWGKMRRQLHPANRALVRLNTWGRHLRGFDTAIGL